MGLNDLRKTNKNCKKEPHWVGGWATNKQDRNSRCFGVVL